MQDFKDLNVWKKAHQLALSSYKTTNQFPSAEQFGLTSQIRRCAVSIMANIAEGRGRGTDADFKRFVQMAIGSTCELECHFILACDLKFVPITDFEKLLAEIVEIRKMLTGLRDCLRN